MASFSNSSDGDALEYQCMHCKYGDEACPIYWVQTNYNYEACNNKVAKAILDNLVSDETGCQMFKRFKKDLLNVVGFDSRR